jgi:hypothetical protein
MAASSSLPAVLEAFFNDPTLPREESHTARKLAVVLCVFSLVSCLLLRFLQAPYGRFASTSYAWLFGPDVNARFAWMIQEIPSLIFFLQVFWSPDLNPECLRSPANVFLSACFLAHYFNR